MDIILIIKQFLTNWRTIVADIKGTKLTQVRLEWNHFKHFPKSSLLYFSVDMKLCKMETNVSSK